jgi:hypothetical protein
MHETCFKEGMLAYIYYLWSPVLIIEFLNVCYFLSYREDLLRLWSEIGTSDGMKCAEDSEEHAKIVGLLKRTCKIIPDAIDASQKEQL